MPTEHNIGDFFTKAQKSPSTFYAMRRLIMNESGPSAHVDYEPSTSDRGGASKIKHASVVSGLVARDVSPGVVTSSMTASRDCDREPGRL